MSPGFREERLFLEILGNTGEEYNFINTPVIPEVKYAFFFI